MILVIFLTFLLVFHDLSMHDGHQAFRIYEHRFSNIFLISFLNDLGVLMFFQTVYSSFHVEYRRASRA